MANCSNWASRSPSPRFPCTWYRGGIGHCRLGRPSFAIIWRGLRRLICPWFRRLRFSSSLHFLFSATNVVVVGLLETNSQKSTCRSGAGHTFRKGQRCASAATPQFRTIQICLTHLPATLWQAEPAANRRQERDPADRCERAL